MRSQQAVEIFEQLGAPAWAEQARAELGRVGLRKAKEDLTSTELRVAELAASGLTNREVAAQAFMSPKTVEANLARVYRKLGIRSRAELGAHIDRRRPEAAPRLAPARGRSRPATILFTDLVGSTEKTRALGDAAWSALLDGTTRRCEESSPGSPGEEIDTAGDGFFAVFDGSDERDQVRACDAGRPSARSGSR